MPDSSATMLQAVAAAPSASSVQGQPRYAVHCAAPLHAVQALGEGDRV